MPRSRSPSRFDQRGFTYLALIILIVLLGIGFAAIGQFWRGVDHHQRMVQLAWVGEQYRAAIGSYYESSPVGVRNYPRTIDELLEDHRAPVPRRHLRDRYPDPITNQDDWILIAAPDGGIMGVTAAYGSGAEGRLFQYLPGAASARPE